MMRLPLTLSEQMADALHFLGFFEALLNEDIEDEESMDLIMGYFGYCNDEIQRLEELERLCN